jgi:hypothetical protein
MYSLEATQLYRFFDFTHAAQVSRKRLYEWARKTQPSLVRSTRLDVIQSHFSWTIPSHYFQLLLFPFDNFQIRKTGFASTTAVDRCVLRLSVYQIETDCFRFGDYSVIRFQWQKYFGRSVTAPTLRAFGATFHNIDMINLHLALAPNSYLWSIEYWSRAIF